MNKEVYILKETIHMIKTHPIKSLAFFGGCVVVVGTGYYAKVRIDNDEAIRKDFNKYKFQQESNDEKLKYLRSRYDLKKEVNNEEIRMVKIMNELKKEANHEEIRARRSRIPWIIRWLVYSFAPWAHKSYTFYSIVFVGSFTPFEPHWCGHRIYIQSRGLKMHGAFV